MEHYNKNKYGIHCYSQVNSLLAADSLLIELYLIKNKLPRVKICIFII
jgi:hypothetical protein